MIVELQRVSNYPAGGMFGRLGRWVTLERPWMDNASGVSCIPEGEYDVFWTLSPRLKRYTFEVLKVQNRAGIRMHSANLFTELLGCIALGEKLGTMDGKRCIFISAPAIRAFEAWAPKAFTLKIKGP